MQKDNRKALTLRMERDLWAFLAKRSVDIDTSINALIINRLNKYKERCEKKLTKNDGMVS